MSLRTAVYARYSSHRQSPASIQDQLRKCREFAAKSQWDFQDAQVYTDEALSGAGADRPGLLKLMAAAGQQPRPFDVLLVDDTSRLSRNMGDVARVAEKFKFDGVRVIAVSQGIARLADLYAKPAHPGLMHRATTSPYLMTGFLKCGSCGANLVIVTGRTMGAHPKYGCPQNFYRGACTNAVKERADWLEHRMLSELQKAVMQPEAADYAIREFERQLHASSSDLTHQVGRMRQRSEQLQGELRNLITMTATCGPSSPPSSNPATAKYSNSPPLRRRSSSKYR
jgi:hypothetical protein